MLFRSLQAWIGRYRIVSVEDPFGEDDWGLWPGFTAAVGDRVQVVGDDLLCTQADRLERAIAEGAANAVLVKAGHRPVAPSELRHLVGHGVRTLFERAFGSALGSMVAVTALCAWVAVPFTVAGRRFQRRDF